MADNREKLMAADVTSIEALIRESREAVEKQDDALITSAMERLDKESQRVAMYAAAAPQPEAEKKDPGNNVVDAEFDDAPPA